jgi:CheY-like chemotaxis protein
VANAIRYTAAGTVWIGARRRGSAARIEVRDSGDGIAREHLERIFEEFYQVGNAERDRRKGLGLGLAIVRRLAALLDHPVDVRSSPGRGSVFAVSAPLAAVPSDREGTAGAADGTMDFPGLKVLLLEDDADVRDAIVLTLREWGCSVLAAADTEEALAALAARAPWRPELILTDYRLRGGGNGAEGARRVTARLGGRIPVALITGDTAAEPLRAAADSGYPLLHKPVRPERLHRLLRALTHGGQGERQP